MTTVAVLADPPRLGLSGLAESTPLSPTEMADLYAAMLVDTCRAVERSGASLLVNYRPGEETSDDAETAVRDALEPALDRPDDARYEVQVGSTFAARVGNTVTHLLDREGVSTVAALEPTAPLVGRTDIDSASMKLRSSEVVLAPAAEGRVALAGFAEPIDFTDAYETPAIGTLTDRARSEGYDVDYLTQTPAIETGADLRSVVAQVRARRRADRPVPPHTAARIEELGLHVVDGPALAR